MTALSEDEARKLLRDLRVSASNPEYYAARRRAHGWLFAWRIETGPPRIGTRSWVVADNGACRQVGFDEYADDAIDALLRGQERRG